MNILLIEPNRMLASTYETKLKSAGHKTVIKRSGQAALDALDDELPDIVVLELQLGVHNGIEYLYELRSHNDWQKVPVIIHTTNPHADDEQFRQTFSQLGVVKILYKPHTTLNQLVKTIDKISVPA